MKATTRSTTATEVSISQLLKRASQLAGDYYAGLGGSQLTQRQYTVLHAVDSRGSASQTEIVRITGIDRSTLGAVVGRPIDQGYLVRHRDDNDGRAYDVALTGRGVEALAAVAPAIRAVDARLLADVPARHRAGFVGGLRALSGKLRPNR